MLKTLAVACLMSIPAVAAEDPITFKVVPVGMGFSEDTFVETSTGPCRIADVVDGRRLLGDDRTAELTNTIDLVETIEIKLGNGEVIIAGVNQKFKAVNYKNERVWVRAADLGWGMELQSTEETVRIDSVGPGDWAVLYTFEVLPSHTFLAGGVIVHNPANEELDREFWSDVGGSARCYAGKMAEGAAAGSVVGQPHAGASTAFGSTVYNGSCGNGGRGRDACAIL